MRLIPAFLFTALITVVLSCQAPIENGNLAIIPRPSSVETSGGFSKIKALYFPKEKQISTFNPWIATWSKSDVNQSGHSNVTLLVDENLEHGAYALNISEELVNISYNEKEGLKNALSSLLQIWELNHYKLPICYILDDRPFSYRGMHLDVSRHLFSIEEVKQYIDYLAFYKMNYFHWHLTDDQGWRIEIKQYPKLQEIAAFRNETLVGHYNDQPHQFDGKKYGGFYTQEEIKDVVDYALARGIETIPEIDIPGHSLALLSAYPNLGCEDKEYQAGTKWGVFEDILCPKEETFDFLNNVFDEIIDLFPSQYIHIGGDECPKSAWKRSSFCQDLMRKKGLENEIELQSYFIQRIEEHINYRGKSIIGWDEILEGGLAPNATVMSWRGVAGGIQAAKENHNVIMTPTSHCYFDYYQSSDPEEPLAIGGYLPISKVYNWQVIPKALSEEKHQYILGGQANVWTEYMESFDQVEYMSLARMATLSEVLWGRKSGSIVNFANALLEHTSYWKGKDKNIANHILTPTLSATASSKDGIVLHIENLMPESLNYILTPGNKESIVMDTSTFRLKKPGTYTIQSEYNGFKSKKAKIDFKPHKGNFAKIKWNEDPAKVYSGSGPTCIINGVFGSNEKYGGSEWLGFAGKDVDMTLTFDREVQLSQITSKNFKGEGQWIYLPKSIRIFNIDDNGKDSLIIEVNHLDTEDKILSTELTFDTITTNKIRIIQKNYGTIPDGKQGAGHESWLFIDEVSIQ